MIDVHNLKEHTDLLNLIASDTQLRRVASTRGGEWAGPCPFCGGRDRFRVQPYTEGGGRWMCRRCTAEKWEDVVAYVMRREHCDFKTACRSLKLGNGFSSPKLVRPVTQVPYQVPNSIWQDRAKNFAKGCHSNLWGSKGQIALDYLHGRGLTDETLHKHQIGYNPIAYTELYSDWGLEQVNEKSEVILFKGITIPCFIEDQIWYLKIRQLDISPKYVQIRGGRMALYGADDLLAKDVALLVEGEFDKLIAEQIVGNWVGVATFGSASSCSIASAWKDKLQNAQATLLALDVDAAGRTGGAGLLEIIPNAHIVRVPVLRQGDKDITDYFLANGNLQIWLTYHLDRLGLQIQHNVSKPLSDEAFPETSSMNMTLTRR